jgi:hypothetical protein
LKSDLPALKLFLEEIEGAVRVKHLKELFWVEAIICGVTVAMAFCGNWGVFAGLAFMSMIVPIWVIALGVWGSVFGVEALEAMFASGSRGVQSDGQSDARSGNRPGVMNVPASAYPKPKPKR